MMSHLSENEAKNVKNGDIHLAQIQNLMQDFEKKDFPERASKFCAKLKRKLGH